MAHQPTNLDQYTDDHGQPAWDCPDCGRPWPSPSAALTCCQD